MLSNEFPLRPLSTGELLDRAFSLYRRNFWKLVGALAVAQVIVTGVQVLSTALNLPSLGTNSESTSLGRLVSFFGLFFFRTNSSPIWLEMIRLVIFDCLGRGALVYLIINTYFGNPISTLQAYRRSFTLTFKLIGARIYAGIVATLAFWACLFSVVGLLPGPGLLFFFFITITPFITVPVIVENQPATRSFKRITGLIMKRFWWVMGIEGALFLLGWVIFGIQVTLSTGISRFVLGTAADYLIVGNLSIRMLMSQFFLMGETVLVTSFDIIVHLLIYLDLRVRFEGLDLILTTEQQANEPQNLVEAIFHLPLPEASYNMTRKNLGKLTIFGWGLMLGIFLFAWFFYFIYRLQ